MTQSERNISTFILKSVPGKTLKSYRAYDFVKRSLNCSCFGLIRFSAFVLKVGD